MIEQYINFGIENGVSDIHLTANLEPAIRVHGEYKTIECEIGNPGKKVDEEELIQFLQTKGADVDRYKEKGSLNFSFSHLEKRIRVNLSNSSKGASASFRVIPSNIPEMGDLSLPRGVNNFLNLKDGLLLVTGPTGSGKSTTCAAILDTINRTKNKKIITLEDPIEFLYEPKMSGIVQREVGLHAESFHQGILDAMRSDLDILLVGEMRDLETIKEAITFASTGHLVIATLHTRSAAETFDRIIDVFPPNQQQQIRVQLANVIQGVLSQQLLVNKEKNGRVPACELLIPTTAIRNNIRNSEGISKAQIDEGIRTRYIEGKGQTLSQGIADLLRAQKIDWPTVLEVFPDEEEIRKIKALIGRQF